MRSFIEEDIIVAAEIVAYMVGVEQETGRSITLEQAYKDKAVSEDMQLTKGEIEKIISEFLSDK